MLRCTLTILDIYWYKTHKFPKQKYGNFKIGKIVFNYYMHFQLC